MRQGFKSFFAALLFLAMGADAEVFTFRECDTEELERRRPGQLLPYCGDLPSLSSVNVRDASVEMLLNTKRAWWAMEFVSPRELLINQINGKLLRYHTETRKIEKIRGLREVATGQGQLGLMDLALHPNFANNRFIYLSYSVEHPSEKQKYALKVSRARLAGRSLTDWHDIHIAEPYRETTANFGGALEFDDKNYLYIGVGDRGGLNSRKAQDLDVSLGKILRFAGRWQRP